jgi:hypothetical protein
VVFRDERPIYAPWRSDVGRALVLAFTPEGKDQRFFATGLRNCVGMAVQPGTGELWCSVNERDGLGDDLVPDFVTRVRACAGLAARWALTRRAHRTHSNDRSMG